MPTIITHGLLGLGAANAWLPKNTKKLPRRFWILSLLLPILPDADVISFAFGLPYDHFLGHRGFFHSLPFALILSVAIVSVSFRHELPTFRRWLGLVAYFFLLIGSHGILDAFTNGGEGIALLAPFDDTRYFFAWRPILVSPIGVWAFFSEYGARVIVSEALWIWLPAAVVLGGVRLVLRAVRRRRRSRR